MRSAILILIALLASTAAHASAAASPETWSPLRVFIGSWSGSRTGAGGADKLVRTYASAIDNQELHINERIGRRSDVWGMIRFDRERQVLVLHQRSPDGHETLLSLDPAASNATRLVFTGIEDNPGQVRVSYERRGWDEFVERVEYAPSGADFTLVSEARFRRRH